MELISAYLGELKEQYLGELKGFFMAVGLER